MSPIPSVSDHSGIVEKSLTKNYTAVPDDEASEAGQNRRIRNERSYETWYDFRSTQNSAYKIH